MYISAARCTPTEQALLFHTANMSLPPSVAVDDDDEYVYFSQTRQSALDINEEEDYIAWYRNSRALRHLCDHIGLDFFHVCRKLTIMIDHEHYIGYWDPDRIVMIDSLDKLRAYLVRVFHAASCPVGDESGAQT